MKPGLLAVTATAAFVAALTPSLAEARGLHVRVGGRVHVSGGVGIHIGPPPPPPPVYYAPAYTAYPEPAYQQPYYAPPAVAAPAPEPRRPMFGIGLMASSISLSNELEGEGGGLIARIRFTDRFQLEGQLSMDRFYDASREDTRLGVAGIFNLGKPGGFTPYLVLGLGANVVHPLGVDDERIADEDLPVQGYLEAGIGIEYEVCRWLVLSADVRAQARRFDREAQGGTARQLVDSFPEKEDAAEGRLNAILYF